MNKLTSYAQVSDSLTLHRYDNGWMIEISGKDTENDWKTSKIICTSQEEVFSLIEEYNGIKVDH